MCPINWIIWFRKCADHTFFTVDRHSKREKQAQKAREKYPERERKTIGLDVIRIKK
jgi:hypothetical protein